MNITRQTRNAQLDQHNARMLIQFSREPDTTMPLTMAKRSTPAGDAARLRGIPAIGRGVGGAIPGTRP